MGYTHYFYIGTKAPVPEGAFEMLVPDASRLFELAASEGIALAGWDGTGQPEATYEAIRFNGVGANSHETMAIEPDSHGFNFCKTASKPYDAVVTALLIRAKDHYGPAIEISSDGEWAGDAESWGDWSAGAALYKTAFGQDAVNPMEES